jgi:hypothetical protein
MNIFPRLDFPFSPNNVFRINLFSGKGSQFELAYCRGLKFLCDTILLNQLL